MAETPEQSAYTSIVERIIPLPNERDCSGDIELVDWTGRAILDNKRGHISSSQPPYRKLGYKRTQNLGTARILFN